MPSTIKAKPLPDVAVMALAPVYAAPIIMLIADISSSGCKNTILCSRPLSAMISNIDVVGVIGYPAMNLQPAAMAPRASASLPVRNIHLPIPTGEQVWLNLLGLFCLAYSKPALQL
jgi:hypothetical protein